MNTDIETIRAIALFLTIETGELFTMAKDRNENDYLVSESAHFRIYKDWRVQNKIKVVADALNMKENKQGESIGLDSKRNPSDLARDIKNRLLSHARKHLTESRAYDERERKKESAANLRKNLLKQFTPDEANGKLYLRYPESRRAQMWTHIDYDNKIEIEITLPIREALQLLKHIQRNYL